MKYSLIYLDHIKVPILTILGTSLEYFKDYFAGGVSYAGITPKRYHESKYLANYNKATLMQLRVALLYFSRNIKEKNKVTDN